MTVADVQHAAAGRRAAARTPRRGAAPAQAAPADRPEPPAADRGPATAAEARERVASLRRAIGALMARSKKTIPHYYLSTTIDLRAAVDWMQAATRSGRWPRLVPAALLLKATALAAPTCRRSTASTTTAAFRPSAPSTSASRWPCGRAAWWRPAIHDADTLPVDELMERLRDLVSRARAGRLQRAEMADPTITVTNLGDLGVESVFGVIYPPQVAIVGFGRVAEQPWAQNGLLGVRPAVTATLSADHRVSDGLRGGRFLDRIDELLQKPEEL